MLLFLRGGGGGEQNQPKYGSYTTGHINTERFKLLGIAQIASLSSDVLSFSVGQVLVSNRSKATGLYQVSSLHTEKEIRNCPR